MIHREYARLISYGTRLALARAKRPHRTGSDNLKPRFHIRNSKFENVQYGIYR